MKTTQYGHAEADGVRVPAVEQGTAVAAPKSIASGRGRMVAPDDHLAINGPDVRAVGGTRATINPDIAIPSVDYWTGRLLHPGDECAPPAVDAESLARPVSGQRRGDAVDCLRVVDPAPDFPVHEAVASRPGLYRGVLQSLKLNSATVRVPQPGVAAELGS